MECFHLMIRKTCSIIFGLYGFIHTYMAMVGAYKTSDITATPMMKIVEFLVFCVFVIPFLGTIGLGFGFLIEAFIGLFKKRGNQPRHEKASELF